MQNGQRHIRGGALMITLKMRIDLIVVVNVRSNLSIVY